MAQFDNLIKVIDPYQSLSNYERSQKASHPFEGWGSASKEREPGLSIVVLNLNKADLLRQIVNGFEEVARLLGMNGVLTELLIGDTGSTESEAVELLNEFVCQPDPQKTVFRELKYHFSKCNNELFRRSRYATSLFLNNDVIIEKNPRAIATMYECLHENQKNQIVGSVLSFGDGSVQHQGIDFFSAGPLNGFCYHPGARAQSITQPGNQYIVSAVTGACLMVRSDAFEKAGGFDEEYSAECQDVDLCLRIERLGGRVVLVDAGELLHLENATRPTGEENWADRSLFIRRWSTYIEAML